MSLISELSKSYVQNELYLVLCISCISSIIKTFPVDTVCLLLSLAISPHFSPPAMGSAVHPATPLYTVSIREASARCFSVTLPGKPSILDEATVTVHSLHPGLGLLSLSRKQSRAVQHHYELLGPNLRTRSVLPDQPMISWVCLVPLLSMTHTKTFHSPVIMPLSPIPRR